MTVSTSEKCISYPPPNGLTIQELCSLRTILVYEFTKICSVCILEKSPFTLNKKGGRIMVFKPSG